MNITEKILCSHLVEGSLTGGEIAIGVDQTLCHDLTGIMAAQVLESLEVDGVSTECSVFYCDHNTLAISVENADDHRYLRTAAARFGIHFSKPGNGICHFVHCQRFAVPGRVMLGADSHSPTSGALGMLAIGAGGMSVASAMVGEPFRMEMPKIINIVLQGRLGPAVSAKDIALHLLQLLTVRGGIGSILEFSGEGVAGLSVPERATLANMSIEMGATTAIFPSDQVTREFLVAQGRGEVWQSLLADADASYDRTITIDLSGLEPLVAKPHMPDLVAPVREVAGTVVDSVFIGSCTNASLADLQKAAIVLKGRKVASTIDLTIAPGSRQVLAHLEESGALGDLLVAGARILECACGPCLGIGQVPASGGVALRTSNRNFPGRSGSEAASVYLVGPETAAASSTLGKITDPRDLLRPEELASLEKVREPAAYRVDDCYLIGPLPLEERKKVEVVRGGNVSSLPIRGSLREKIEAPVAIKLGDNITTDDIIPANAEILRHIGNIPKFAEFTFCYSDPGFVARIKSMPHSIIVAGENYGQGSSREHAALLPMFFGVEAVIAKSYARIHRENLINYGILPLMFSNRNDYQLIEEGEMLCLGDVVRGLSEGHIIIHNLKRSLSFKVYLPCSARDRRVLLAGGAINDLQRKILGQ